MASALGREPLAGQFLQTLPPILLRLKCLCAHPLTTANPLSHFRHRLTRGHSQENGDCADDIHIFANAHSYTIGSSIPFKNRPLSSKYSRKKGRAAAGSGYRREEQAFSLAVRWGDQNRSPIRKSGAQDPHGCSYNFPALLRACHIQFRAGDLLQRAPLCASGGAAALRRCHGAHKNQYSIRNAHLYLENSRNYK